MRRGSALVTALLLTVVLCVVGLVLLLTTIRLRPAGGLGDPARRRQALEEGLSAAASAASRGEAPAAAGEWLALPAKGAAPAVSVSRPAFLAYERDPGTDLASDAQCRFEAEVHNLAARTRSGQGARMSGELVLSPAAVDVLRLARR